MVIVLLANGFEELEAITPVDVLRRSNVDVRTVSITNEKLVTGTHGIQIAADLIASDVPLDGIEMLILPGGMPGVKNLDASPITKIFIDSTLKNNGHLAAICAAPSIFGKHGMLTNIKATCFPGFENEMLNAVLQDTDVITDGVFTTARDYKSASAFAEELIRVCKKQGILPKDENEENEENEDQRINDFKNLLKELISENPPRSLEDIMQSLDSADDDDFELEFDDEDYISLEEPLEDRRAVEDELEIVGSDLAEEEIGEAKECAEKIKRFYLEKDIVVFIKRVDCGPRLMKFYLTPAPGEIARRVTELSDDIGLMLGRDGIRFECPIPRHSAIGIEVPYKRYSRIVKLSDLLEDDEFRSFTSPTAVAIGKDTAGKNIYSDVATFPHAIISGATGMGKSVLMYSLLTSMIYKSTPNDLRFILIDPKMVEFRAFNELPHLLTPVITDLNVATGALKWAVNEMERRYQVFNELKARSINNYNESVDDPKKKLPKIIIMIDELADLMYNAHKETELYIQTLAQKARAAGIHLIIGTQRPSFDVLSGHVKANIPTRISFKLASSLDSVTVLNTDGAEKLLHGGDMLFSHCRSQTPARLQCAFISDGDLEEILDKVKLLYPDHTTDESVTKEIHDTAKAFLTEKKNEALAINNPIVDPMFLQAVDVAIATGKISTSMLQRKLMIGYGKAAKYIDMMENVGIIGEFDGQLPRKIIITDEAWKAKLEEIKHLIPEEGDAEQDYFSSKQFMTYLDSFFISEDEEEEDENTIYEDERFIEAVELAIKHGKISTSLIQRKLSIGYGKAARYIDAMEDLGIVSEPNGQKPRKVLITLEEWRDKLERARSDED